MVILHVGMRWWLDEPCSAFEEGNQVGGVGGDDFQGLEWLQLAEFEEGNQKVLLPSSNLCVCTCVGRWFDILHAPSSCAVVAGSTGPTNQVRHVVSLLPPNATSPGRHL